jgi:tetratricopeptide (TPR) repeat protein
MFNDLRDAPFSCIHLRHNKSPVTHPSQNLSNEQYINGLREADEAVLEAVYAEFRQPVVRAVTALGGGEATGKAFFRTAVVETGRLNRAGELPAEVPFFFQIKNLALAHYKDWLAERGQPLPESEPASDEPDLTSVVPASEALRETRQKMDVWKKGEQTDGDGYALWEKMRRIEHKFGNGETVKPQGNFSRNLFILFVLLTIGYVVYAWIDRTKTPAEVYDDNFTLPESIMADLRLRYGPERGNDSVSARPNKCELILREADNFYKSNDYASAQAVLFQIVEDELAVCQSDAFFYIGIIALQQEEPELALECFSKIEDLEHFGEDIYWYQALAFVKLAETNPLLRDKAARAVERTRSNTQDSLRRVQAEKMLKHLAE